MDSSESESPLLRASTDGFPDKHLDDDVGTELTQNTHKQRPRRPTAYLIWHATTLALAAWGTISLCLMLAHATTPSPNTTPPTTPVQDVYRPWTLPRSYSNCDCTTDREARNCVYDALAAAWLPPHCRDAELTAEFSRSGPGPNGTWTYFADATGTKKISVEGIAALEPSSASFWVHREWHLAHCVFYWQKYMRMRVTGATMEARFDNVPHVKHCGHLLTKEPPKERILIEVEVMVDSRLVLGKSKGGMHDV
jgi:hypothetical protein